MFFSKNRLTPIITHELLSTDSYTKDIFPMIQDKKADEISMYTYADTISSPLTNLA